MNQTATITATFTASDPSTVSVRPSAAESDRPYVVAFISEERQDKAAIAMLTPEEARLVAAALMKAADSAEAL